MLAHGGQLKAVSLLELPTSVLRRSATTLLLLSRLATLPARTAGRLTLAASEDLLALLERASTLDPPDLPRSGPSKAETERAGEQRNGSGSARAGVPPVSPAAVREGKKRASTPGIGADVDLTEPALPATFVPDRDLDLAAEPEAVPLPEPAPAPPTPAPEPVPAHVDQEAELVAEFADAGAEDPPGAAVRVEPPWPGYGRLKAPDVIDRLAAEDTAALSVLLLYERAHRARRSVIAATQRELARRAAVPAGH